MKNIIFLTLFSFFSISNCFAQFGGGEGTAARPYQIKTAEHLNNIKKKNWLGDYLYLDKFFVQLRDIDLNIPPYNLGAGWEPIGNTTNPFNGVYESFGYKIFNLFINRPDEDNVGLFGVVMRNGGSTWSYDLKMIDVNITGRNNVGAAIGYGNRFFSIGTYGKMYVSGDVHGEMNVGGFIGYAHGSALWDISSDCNVYGVTNVGGIIGLIQSIFIPDEPSRGIFLGSVYQCRSFGIIEGDSNVGGIVGQNYQGKIDGNYSKSTINASGIRAGGLIGYSNCEENGFVTNNYSMGEVNGNDVVGGLIGYRVDTPVNTSYSNSAVNSAGFNTGGLIGAGTGTIDNCYWNIETSGQVTSAGGEGRTTEEMTYPYTENTYIDWNFIYWREDFDQGEGVYYNEGYPYFKWQKYIAKPNFAGGSGTEEDPYLVATAYQLDRVRFYPEAFALQIQDIDLGSYNAEQGWEPINNFKGRYDGNHYTISNLIIDNPAGSNIGLFGNILQNAVLQNITLQNIEITGFDNVGGLAGFVRDSEIINSSSNGIINGSSNNVGGFVGKAENSTLESCHFAGIVEAYGHYAGGLVGYCINSIILNCYSSGSVGQQAISNHRGGLVGFLHDNSHVISCFSSSNVRGSQGIGGLVGFSRNSSTIHNSYAKGIVDTNNPPYAGGLVGMLYGLVEDCYSTGEIITTTGTNMGLIGFNGYGSGVVTTSYWNMETSGQSASAGGIGKTTSEMTFSYDEFTYQNWNFTDIWVADEIYSTNNGYPYLRNIVYHQQEISEPVVGDILINEICGVDVYPEFSLNGYIELLNVRPYPLSLDNVQVKYYDNASLEPTGSMALNGIVGANQYIVIAQDFFWFYQTHGNPAADFQAPLDMWGNSVFPLDGGEDTIEIYLGSRRMLELDTFNNVSEPWSWNSNETYRRKSFGDGSIEDNWGPGDGIPGEDDYTELSVPDNVQISFLEGNINLNWQVVWGATTYKIYSANYSQAIFPDDWQIEISGIEGTSWIDVSPEENRKFYRIVAVKQRQEK